MPIGTGIVYNTGDLILSQVSSSGTAFLETKIAAATSSLIYFDSTARINSASLNSITVGTASYVSGSNSIITNLTASNISASGTSSFGYVGIGTVNPAYKLDVNGNANFTNGFYTNTDASSTSYFVGANGTRPIIFQNNTATSYDFGFKFTDSNTFTIVGGNTLANPTTDLVSFKYDGKVGIGTTNPSALLHIYTGSLGSTAYPLLIDNSSGGAGVNVVGIGFANGGIMKHSITTAIYGNDYMAFNVGQGASYNQERMRIDSNGNVGIGMISPTTKLHVSGSITALDGAFISNVTSGTDRYFLNCYGTSTNWIFSLYENNNTAYLNSYSNMAFRANQNGGSGGYFIFSGANVGIGTTIPNNKLDIWGGTGTTLNMANVDDSGRGGKLTFISSSVTGRQFYVGTNSSIYNLVFGIDSIERARIDTSGNLGIGITNPSSRLHISGSSSTAITITDDALYTNSITNDNSVMTYTVDTGNAAAASAAHVFRRFNTELVRIDSSGNVGIGTTVPINKLQVAGNISGSSFTSSISNAVGFLGTSSWAQNVVSASYALTSSVATSETLATVTGRGASTSTQITVATAAGGSMYTGRKAGSSYGDGVSGATFKSITDNSQSFATSYAFAAYYSGSTGINSFYVSSNGDGYFSGSVGIGTTSPNSKLEVAGPAGTAVVSVTNSGNGRSGSFGIDGNGVFIRNSNNGDYFDLENASGTSKFRVVYDNNTFLNTTYTSVGSLTASGSKLSVFGNLSVGSTYGAITASSNGAIFEGDVGIGTTTPTAQSNYRFLQVNGSNSAVIETMVGGTRIGGFDSTSNTLYVGSIGSFPVVFRTAVDEKMRITAAGLVGIGTSSPAQKLEVQSGSVLIRGDGNALFGTYYASAGENTFFTLHSGSGNTFHIGNDVAGTNYNTMVFTAATDTTGGKVGIGTSSPGSKLQINDNTPVLTIRANDGGVSRKAYIDFYTTFFNFPSDVGARRTSTISTGFSTGVWGTEYMAFHVGSGSSNDAALLPIERVRIDGSGNVGIGVTNPLGRLHITASATSAESLIYLSKGSGSISQNYINAVNQSGQINYRLTSDINGHAQQSLYLAGTIHVYHDSFWSNYINNANYTQGGLGIGTSSLTHGYGLTIARPATSGSLYVSGSSVFTGSVSINGLLNATASWANNVVSASFATTAQTANALNASNTYTIAGLTSAYVDVTGAGTIPTTGIYRPSTKTLGLSADGTLVFKISNVSAPATSSIETGNFIVQSGNIGIGTANATDKLTVYGELASYKTGADTIQTQVYLANTGNTRAFNLQLNSGGTGLDLWSYNSSNLWQKHTTFDYNGNVGIGTAAPAAKLEISGSSNSALLNVKSPISGAILYVSGSGAVGINTTTVGAFTLQVNGSFGATTKSFIIDHPTKEGKKLMYGSLESPYHGIRLTGRDTLVNGKCKIQLPDYMYKLILHDSVNIQLTGIKCNKTLYVDDINIPENYFTIAYDKAMFESYKDYDFFWDFTAIRADVPELTTEL